MDSKKCLFDELMVHDNQNKNIDQIIDQNIVHINKDYINKVYKELLDYLNTPVKKTNLFIKLGNDNKLNLNDIKKHLIEMFTNYK